MDDTTARAALRTLPGAADRRRFTALHRRFPTVAFLRKRAPHRVPRFAFEYMDGGAGADYGIKRNWAALDAVELVPRYGLAPGLPPVDMQLFGRRYAAPIGIAPMGGPGVVWPGADEYLAQAAQKLQVPYTLGTVGGMAIERAAELAPDVFWFQLYRFAQDDHAVGFDLVRRADAAGAHVLMLTLDVPVRTTRSREVHAGITNPFKLNARMVAGVATSPRYLMALAKYGQPKFVNFRPYLGDDIGPNAVSNFLQSQSRGAFTWDEVARYRDRWKRPLVVKGIMHPGDAERAVSLGVDGVVVSNHGGRQIEALPAPIDVLPAVAAAVGSKTTVLMDSGIRSGIDTLRAIALGAEAVLVGKAFLWGLGALGPEGPEHVINLMTDELRSAFGQIGARSAAEARAVVIRHPGALTF
jgi:L-lactate dehydrogenase (cytochrome)